MKSDNKSLIQNNTAAFEEVISIIERARENAFRAVNHELISMYWEIGRYIVSVHKVGYFVDRPAFSRLKAAKMRFSK